jgi:uncharacterized protein YjiS (DUF1127 family)
MELVASRERRAARDARHRMLAPNLQFRSESMVKMRFAYKSAAACSAPGSSRITQLGALFGKTKAMPRVWSRRRYERRALLQLDDHMLRDVGLDRFQAEAIAARPFWRA